MKPRPVPESKSSSVTHNGNITNNSGSISYGNNSQATTHNEEIHIAGSVSGGNLNIGGTQTVHGDMNISSTPAADVRRDLDKQIKALMMVLDIQFDAPTAHVQAIQVAVEDVIVEAEKPTPNPQRLKNRGDMLLTYAQTLPAIMPIAAQIAETLLKLG